MGGSGWGPQAPGKGHAALPTAVPHCLIPAASSGHTAVDVFTYLKSLMGPVNGAAGLSAVSGSDLDPGPVLLTPPQLKPWCGSSVRSLPVCLH